MKSFILILPQQEERGYGCHPAHGKMYQVEAMAVGNGTASRETSDWLHSIDFVHPVDIYGGERGWRFYLFGFEDCKR